MIGQGSIMETAMVEMPTWWLFPGRWGIKVMNRGSGQWDNGTRRVDVS